MSKALSPQLIVLPSDPDKYRFVNHKLLGLLQQYTSDVEVKSIDEMVINLKEYGSIAPLLHCWKTKNNVTMKQCDNDAYEQIIMIMTDVALEIKSRIKDEIGEWLRVSIVISSNRYLAKVASGLHKPDGLDIITKDNIEVTLGGLQLEDLCGIKQGYGGRLRRYGITTPRTMYRATVAQLRSAFASKIGYDWWLWLHGWDPSSLRSSGRGETKSIGHSYALRISYRPTDIRLHQILCQLVEKMGRRLREHQYKAQGIRISCLFTNHTYWNHGEKLTHTMFTSHDLYEEALRVLGKAPNEQVRILAVTCFSLSGIDQEQLHLLDSRDRKQELTKALDAVADRWGELSVFPARMLGMEQRVLDRIAFGGVGDIAPLDK